MRALVLATVAAATLEGERDLSEYTYETYKAEFGVRNGEGREEVFNGNLELIKRHNLDASKTWFATVNQFTDMTNEEFAAQVKGRKRPSDLFGGSLEPFELSSGDIPASKDWRDESNVVTPVKDQASCGSCWAFSATETFESHLALALGEPVQTLSPQQIVSCAPNPQHCGGTGGCDGSTQPLAFDYTKTAGLTTEASYPYQGITGSCQSSKIAPVGFNAGVTNLPGNNYTALISTVANVGPVAISIAASGQTFQFYGGGVLSKCGDFDMDHAVQLVGYGTDSGKDYWLVRNSWGEWGEAGYIRMQRYGEGKEPCGVDKTPQDGDACEGDTARRTYCGECGILSASSYPTGMSKTQGPPSPPTPPTPPAPTPPPPPPPPPSIHDCGDETIDDEDVCKNYIDKASNLPCKWCYLAGFKQYVCTTPASDLCDSLGEAVAV